MASLNPRAPVFIPRQFEAINPTKKSKSKPKPKYRSKNGDLWSPPKGWLAFYRCQACKNVMSKKEPSKCPQQIHSCKHITCAKCIVQSFLVDLNPLCPVNGCNKCVNPKQKVATAPLEIFAEEPTTIEMKEIITPPATPIKEFDFEHLLNYDDLLDSKAHYCGDWICPGDCGVLWCGCIDQCRGRCGLNDRIFDHW